MTTPPDRDPGDRGSGEEGPGEGPPGAQASGDTSPEVVVRSYLASFAARDVDRIAAHVSEGFVNDHTAKLGSGCVGKTAYAERLPGFLADMVDLEYHVEDLVAAGDRVAVFYRMTARYQGASAIEIRGAQRLVVREGLIAHRTDYWDSAVFLDQID